MYLDNDYGTPQLLGPNVVRAIGLAIVMTPISAIAILGIAPGYPDPAGAMHRAIIAIGDTIRAQATIMGYADSFALIGVILLIAVAAVALLRKGSSAGAAAH